MKKKFEQNGNEVEVNIFRKVITLKHNLDIDFSHPLRPNYSCYDLVVLKKCLTNFFSELMIETISLWIEDNCEYLGEAKQGTIQTSLF